MRPRQATDTVGTSTGVSGGCRVTHQTTTAATATATSRTTVMIIRVRVGDASTRRTLSGCRGHAGPLRLVVQHRVQRPHPVAGDLDQPYAGCSSQSAIRSVSSMPAAGSGSGGRSTVSAVARTARATACGTSCGVATPTAASRP